MGAAQSLTKEQTIQLIKDGQWDKLAPHLHQNTTAPFTSDFATDDKGNSLLALALVHADCPVEAVSALVTPSNVNVLDACRVTPLLRAVYHGRWDLVMELVKQGADLDMIDNYNNTPLSAALYNHSRHAVPRDICQLLVTEQNVNRVQSLGRSPLHKAASNLSSSMELAHVLLEEGADVNLRDRQGATPFLTFCFNRSPFRNGLIELLEKMIPHDNKQFFVGMLAILTENTINLEESGTKEVLRLLCRSIDHVHIKSVHFDYELYGLDYMSLYINGVKHGKPVRLGDRKMLDMVCLFLGVVCIIKAQNAPDVKPFQKDADGSLVRYINSKQKTFQEQSLRPPSLLKLAVIKIRQTMCSRKEADFLSLGIPDYLRRWVTLEHLLDDLIDIWMKPKCVHL